MSMSFCDVSAPGGVEGVEGGTLGGTEPEGNENECAVKGRRRKK